LVCHFAFDQAKQGNMPITKSAKKALRQNVKRKARNIVYKKKIKDLVKKVRNLVLEKKFEEAKNLLPQIYKALDKAGKVGVVKKNTASRKKSRITKLVNKKED
jgi:small subunit ribosomal protein S20